MDAPFRRIAARAATFLGISLGISLSIVGVGSALAAAVAQDQPAAPPAPPCNVVEVKTLGASLASLQFVDEPVNEAGKRIEPFAPIPDGIAFEVWLDSRPPRKVYVEDPADPTKKIAKNVVSVLRIPDAEWDDYVAFVTQDIPPGGDVATFETVVVNSMLDQKSTLLARRDDLPSVEQRAAPALQKLRRGVPFKQVVRVHSEDQTSASADGLLDQDTRGGYFDQYPFAKLVFELNPGDVVGPVYDKNCAYVLRLDKKTPGSTSRFDRADISGVVIRYQPGPGPGSMDVASVRASVRVRTNEERFHRILAPGIQVPTPKTFGPDDIAPVGTPDAKLKRAGE
jgi:hypothetical protein